MSKRIDLTGQRFGRLKAIQLCYTEKRGSMFDCLCDCGKQVMVWAYNLRNGHTTSCGCARVDAMRISATKHGMYGDRFYNIYRQIIRRCTEKTHKAYPNYGGKGIQNLWESFEEFRQDMYKSYCIHVDLFGEKNTTIDRINSNGHYCKDNCRWVNLWQQNLNRTNNHLLTYKGETKPLTQWAREKGFKRGLLENRLRRGWSVKKSLEEPTISKFSH